jgi:protein-disulfide isomerase
VRKPVDLALLAAILFCLAFLVRVERRPGSFVRRQWSDYRRSKSADQYLAREWQTIESLGSRLDTSSVSSSILVFSDYECSFCRQVDRSIDSALGREAIGATYLHFPLPIHSAAEGAARAAICADEQRRFLPMHRRLMSSTRWQRDTNWLRAAREAAVPDMDAFAACLASSSTRTRLARVAAIAESLAVVGTPTFFGRRRRHDGSLSASAFERMVRK